MENLAFVFKIFDRFKDAYELSSAIQDYQDCQKILAHYERSSAIEQIQKVIMTYESEIQQLSLLGGRTVVYHVDYATWEDAQIRESLLYLCENIPYYALLHFGEKELVKSLLKERGNI